MMAHEAGGTTGSLPGSTALMLRTPDGSCSAALCNTGTEPQAEMDSTLYQMLWDQLREVSG